jgi:ribonuclease HII
VQHSLTGAITGPIAGVDEAGRGPLAGPVVAAAVILDAGRPIDGLADSKRLTATCRAQLAVLIEERALAWAVAWADAAEIDRINILQATFLAMRRAVLGLRVRPGLVEVDGNRLPELTFSGKVVHGSAIVGGDGKIAAISAASIIAKVHRDRMMQVMDTRYPQYGFARHKGYGTEEHRAAIRSLGPCRQHRMSFRPCSTST